MWYPLRNRVTKRLIPHSRQLDRGIQQTMQRVRTAAERPRHLVAQPIAIPGRLMPTNRGHHPIFARVYERLSVAMDRGGMAKHRGVLLAGLTGRVIEVGAGNGLNFAHYPEQVSAVFAVEPEPYLRQAAVRAAATAPVPVEITAGAADHLPVRAASFDAAVVSLVLCSVPDQARALAEIRRVLRPGGQLRFLEHVRAETWWLPRIQTVMDAAGWTVLSGGCHVSRETLTAIESAGFVIDHVTRFRFPDRGPSLGSSPHVRGSATCAPSDPA